MTRTANWGLLLSLAATLTAGRPAAGYIADSRWTSTATNGSVTSVGTPGFPVTVTWSLVPDGTSVPDGDGSIGSDLRSFLDSNWGVGPGGTDLTLRPWFPIFKSSFDRLAELSGLSFVYEPFDDGVAIGGGSGSRGIPRRRGDVRLSGKSYGAGSNVLATNYYPDIGDMMINTDQAGFFLNSSNSYRAFRNTLMHELMHGIGISHVESNTSGFLIEPGLSTDFDGPQLDDLLGIQRLYGDANEKNGGNDTITAATSAGTLTLNQPTILGRVRNGTAIAANESGFISIDDDSDTDFFSFTLNETANLRVSADPRGATYMVGPQGGTQQSFNSLVLNDLSLTLLGSSGTVLFNSVNAKSVGLGESIVRQLDPGTYHVRVKGSLNDIQLYQLLLQATTATARSLTWTGGAGAAWDVNSSLTFTNGINPDVFRPGDNVVFDDSATQTVSVVGDVSAGAVTVNTAGAYVFDGSGRITAGSITLAGAGDVTLAISGNSYSGPTNVQSGTLRITGDANAMVTPITVSAGGHLVLNPTDAAGMTSPIDIQAGGTMDIGAAASAANAFPDSPVAVTNNGLIRVLNGELLRDIRGSGELRFVSDVSQVRANSEFDGLITVASGAILEVEDTAGLGSATGATVVASGGMLKTSFSGELSEAISLAADAQLQLSPGVALTESAQVGGNGTVVGNLALAGKLVPGESIGSLTISGDLTLQSAASIEVEIGGLSMNEYDVIDVAGAAALAGTLQISLTSDFTPAAGCSFTLLTAAQVSGAIAQLTAPSLDDGLHWHLEQSDTSLVLSVQSTVVTQPADFNGDGVVDGADLGVWQNGYSSTGDGVAGDANSDLSVDGADFLAWQQQYGTPTPAATAVVPEPVAMWLWALGGAASVYARLRNA